MKQLLKKTVCLITILALALSFAACGQTSSSGDAKTASEQPGSTVAEPAQEVKTLSLLTFVEWYKSGWQALEKDINDNSATLGFKLDIQKIAGGNEGEQVVKAKFASNDLPDLLQFYNPQWIDTAVHGLDKLVDLTGISSVSEYDESNLNSGYRYKGKLYSMPIDTTTLLGVMYNKKVFSDLGIAVPNNWDEFLAACEKIKAAGKVPVYYAGKDSWTLQSFAHFGFTRDIVSSGKTFEDFWKDMNTNKRKYVDNKNFIEAIKLSKTLIDKGYVNKTYLSDTYDSSQKAVAEGTAAMHINGTWYVDEIAKKYPDKLNDIGAFPLPLYSDGNNYVNIFLPGSIGVTTNCKDVELGKKAIDYITSSKAQQLYADAQPGIYINKNVKAQLPPAHSELVNVMNTGKVMANWQGYNIYPYGSFDRFMQDYYVDAKTPEEVAGALDAETVKNAKAQNDPNWK